jgi:hypothetical protein
MMTKSGYERMAAELRATRRQIMTFVSSDPGMVGISVRKGPPTVAAILDDYTRAVARALAADNPNFDAARFMAAAEADRP